MAHFEVVIAVLEVYRSVLFTGTGSIIFSSELTGHQAGRVSSN